jgi:iron(III) transport system permease protein
LGVSAATSSLLPSRRQREGFALLGLVALVTLLLAVWPVARLLWAALMPAGVFDPEAMVGQWSGRSATRAAWHSLETSFWSALGALLLGAAFAILLAVSDVRGKRPLAFLFVFSLMVAPQVAALAYLSLAGPASPVLGALGLAPAPGTPNPLLGRDGIILVMALHHAPLVAITVWAGLRFVPRSVIEAARVDGARPLGILGRIVLPLIAPHLVAGALMAFVAGVGNFGIPALLGLPVNYATLPTLIYRRITSFGPSTLPDAAALSMLVALIAAAGLVASALILKARRAPLETDHPMEPFWRLGRAGPLVAIGLWLVILAKVGLPFLALLADALRPALGVSLSLETLTLAKFAEVLFRQDVTVRAFLNSFLYAGLASVILAVVAVVMAYTLSRRLPEVRGMIESMIEAPYALPGVVLAVACILMFLKPLPLIDLSLYGTGAIIVFAYLARFLAPALKGPLAAMGQLDPAHEEAARLDGASLFSLLAFVIAPLLAPAAAASALLVFLVAFNELTVSALLWSAGTETIGVVLFSLKEAGLAGEAAAVAISASAVVALAMLALDRLAGRMPDGVVPWRL